MLHSKLEVQPIYEVNNNIYCGELDMLESLEGSTCTGLFLAQNTERNIPPNSKVAVSKPCAEC